MVTILGLVVYAGGAKDVTHYESVCPDHNCGTGPDATANASAANTARNKKITGGVITGVGLATVAGGAGLVFSRAAERSEQRRPARRVRCANHASIPRCHPASRASR